MKSSFKKASRAQTIAETLFVFGSIFFITFAIMSFSIAMHTKFVATYAGFMAARSYQVYGDQRGADFHLENSEQKASLLSDLSEVETLSVVRAAEDIFTCALPWMAVPEGDELSSFDEALNSKSQSRCLEGKRKYEKTNIDKKITFYRFEDKSLSSNQNEELLDPVPGAYAEPGRAPLRFSIMRLRYKNPMLTGLMEVFDRWVLSRAARTDQSVDEELQKIYDGKVWFEVYVPALLNPSLDSGVKKASGRQDESEPEPN
ncbi:MAG: TadE family protein [Bdellovibrionota bacterium]